MRYQYLQLLQVAKLRWTLGAKSLRDEFEGDFLNIRVSFLAAFFTVSLVFPTGPAKAQMGRCRLAFANDPITFALRDLNESGRDLDEAQTRAVLQNSLGGPATLREANELASKIAWGHLRSRLSYVRERVLPAVAIDFHPTLLAEAVAIHISTVESLLRNAETIHAPIAYMETAFKRRLARWLIENPELLTGKEGADLLERQKKLLASRLQEPEQASAERPSTNEAPPFDQHSRERIDKELENIDMEKLARTFISAYRATLRYSPRHDRATINRNLQIFFLRSDWFEEVPFVQKIPLKVLQETDPRYVSFIYRNMERRFRYFVFARFPEYSFSLRKDREQHEAPEEAPLEETSALNIFDAGELAKGEPAVRDQVEPANAEPPPSWRDDFFDLLWWVRRPAKESR